MTETWLAVDGGTLRADTAGPRDGAAVILLHGYPQTAHTWRQQLPALADAGFHAVAPDQRGYSPSLRPTEIEAYGVDRLVADVAEIVDALGAPAHLVGHDWGGQVAWLSAARHPELFASLSVLSRPHPAAFAASFTNDPDQADRSRHHRAFDDPDTADRLLADDARRLRRVYANNGVSAADADAYLRVLGDRAALDAALNWYRAATGGGLRASATPAITVPTLYVWGNDDSSVGRTAAEATSAHVTADYTFLELDGHGHFLTDDGGTDTVTRALLEHLGRHRTG